MNIKSVEKQAKSTVELVIEVSHEEFEVAIEKIYKKQRGSISVPGFRKGHAPRKVIEGMYGSAVFYEDAINELYPEVYLQAAKQENLDTVAWPKVEIQNADKNGFTFKAIVAVRPEVKLGEYKGLTAPKAEVIITDDDVETELKPLVSRATRMVDVDRAAQLGDTVTLDFEGLKDGVPFEGGSAEGHALELGSGSFIPGFEDQVVGMSVEDEKEINVIFPTEYQAEELAGQPAVFKVKVHAVKEKQEPTVDDEFAKDVSEFDTLEQLKKDLGDKLSVRREADARRGFEEALMEQVSANMEVEIPDAMVEFQADKLLENYAQRITSQGIPFESYLSMMGLSMADMKTQATEGALHQIRRELALDTIATAEHIEVSEEEIDAELKKLAEQHQLTVEEVKEAVPADSLKTDISQRKAANLVFDSAKIGEAPKAEKVEAVEAVADVEKTKKSTEKKNADGEEKPKRKTAAKKKEEEKPVE